MIFLQDDESKQQFMVDTGAVCSVLPHRSKAQPAALQRRWEGHSLLGAHLPPPNVLATHIFCHLFARRRLQTHTRVRLLVRPQAAGQPSQPPGAGLKVSEADLQSENRRQGTAPNSLPPSAP
jgi:hypothetical protein